ADFGPTVVERNDPLFRISERCCVWSGNSWPFATSQTLKAMSNVLNNYDNIDEVSGDDFFRLFKIFTLTHRKEGKPYIAEALHPDTGSWDGHDVPGHSEHYSHSSYVDLVIADLIGIKAQASDSVIIKPLVPNHWDYFILEDINYHGHEITVLWDRTGLRYNMGQGFQLISDGKTIASDREIKELKAYVPYKKPPVSEPRPVNYAVNNRNDFFPRAIASFPGISHPVQKLNDGQYWYLTPTTNQWSNIYSEEDQDWAGIDFGTEREIENIIIYFVEDDDKIRAPENYNLEYWDGTVWKEIPGQKRQYKSPQARKGNSITFEKLATG
ncbi:MAG: discoidin domain-containing protein, partial [Bacteroidales bacterium]|nr:discoidin domain-containing protein [Bacteroidales bacterium]